MSDGYFVTNNGRTRLIHHVDAAIVLHITAISDLDIIYITPDSTIEPYTGFMPKSDISNDISTGSYEIGVIYFGGSS
jgi:hypothetical protein